MPDQGDPKIVSDQRARSGRSEATRAVVWRTLLSQRDGRDMIWWLLEQANMSSSTFRGEETHWSAFNEGKRAMMIPIQAEVIRADPQAYLKMVIENSTTEIGDAGGSASGTDEA